MSDPLLDRIEEAWNGLTPQEQRVAGFLRGRPEEVALSNSAELARMTGVSKATVSRLFRRLGFAGSAEVRDLQRAQRRSGAPVALGAVPDPIAAAVAQDSVLLERGAAGVDADLLQEIAGAIARAGRVLVLGFRSAYPFALLFRQQLAQLRPDTVLAPAPGQSLGEELVGLGAADVVVVLAIRRRPAELVTVVDAAVRTGAEVLVIADPTFPPVPAVRWRIETPIEAGGAFDRYVAVVALLSNLADAVLAASPAAAARVAGIGARYRDLAETE